MKFLYALLIIFPVLSANAQECGRSFEEVPVSCIQNLSGNFEKLEKREQKRIETLERALEENKEGNVIKLAEIEKDLIFMFDRDIEKTRKEYEDKIFLFQSATGLYGKLIIKSISKTVGSTKEETKSTCSMFINSVVFGPKGSEIVKNVTLSIESIAGAWSVDRVSLDENGTDFVLRREHGLCVFKRVNAYAFPYKKFIQEEEEGKVILLYFGLFLIGLSIFLVARTIFQDDERYKAKEKLEDAEVDEKRETPNDVVLKYSRPFFKRYFTPVIMGMKGRRKIKEKYKRTLASSGMNKFLSPEDFYAFKLFLIIGFPIVYLGLRSFLEVEEDWPLSLTPVISIAGFFYPDVWIKGKIAQRQKEITLSMPFIVDMLALSVEAGLDFVAAMQRVIEKAPPSPLVDEFETMIKETKIGLSRAEALRQLSWRVDTLPVASFCATLISADAVGADIAPILKTLAKEIRQKRSSMAEQEGAKAATKILLPMIFITLPAVLLIIAAPMVMKLMGGE